MVAPFKNVHANANTRYM